MANATLKVSFCRPGTEDRGEMAFQGESDFLVNAAAALSYTISHLAAAYGVERDNWMKTGNELTAAWEAAKEGKPYAGDIVTLTIGE